MNGVSDQVDRHRWVILNRRVRFRQSDRGQLIMINTIIDNRSVGGQRRSSPDSTLTRISPRSIVSVDRCRACPSLRMALLCRFLRRRRIKLHMLQYINRRFLHRHQPLYHRDKDMVTVTRCQGRYRRVLVGTGMPRRMEAIISLLRLARMERYLHYPHRLLCLCLKGIRLRSLRLVRFPNCIPRNRPRRAIKRVTDRPLRFNLLGHQCQQTIRHSLRRTQL